MRNLVNLYSSLICVIALSLFLPSCNKGPTCGDGIQNGTETGVDCGGECLEKCKSSEKKVLDVKLSPSSTSFPPVVNIDNNKFIINVYLSSNFGVPDISNIDLQFTWSERAIMLNFPKNFTNPVDITVRAEDGSTQIYKVNVTQVIGSHAILVNGTTTTIEQIRSIYQNVSLVQNGSDVKFAFLPKSGITNNDDYAFNITLKNKNLNTSMIGSIDLKNSNQTSVCSFRFPKNGGNITYGTPNSGTLQITKHDLTNKIISGKVTNLNYNGANSSEKHNPTLEFKNVPYN